MQRQLCDSIPQDGFLYQKDIASGGSDLLDHLQDVVPLLLQYSVHLGVVTDDDIVLQVCFGRRNLKLHQSNLGILNAGRTASRLCSLVIKDHAVHHFRVIHCASQLGDNLDVFQVQAVGQKLSEALFERTLQGMYDLTSTGHTMIFQHSRQDDHI